MCGDCLSDVQTRVPAHSRRASVANGRYPGPTQYTDKNTKGVATIKTKPATHVNGCVDHLSGTYTVANCAPDTST